MALDLDKLGEPVDVCHAVEQTLTQLYDTVAQEEQHNGLVETDYSTELKEVALRIAECETELRRAEARVRAEQELAGFTKQMATVAELKQKTFAVYKALRAHFEEGQASFCALGALWRQFEQVPLIDSSSSLFQLELQIEETQSLLRQIEHALQRLPTATPHSTQQEVVFVCGKQMFPQAGGVYAFWSEARQKVVECEECRSGSGEVVALLFGKKYVVRVSAQGTPSETMAQAWF